MQVEGTKFRQLQKILLEALRTTERIETAIKYAIDDYGLRISKFDVLTKVAPNEYVFDLIEKVNTVDGIEYLICGALRECPDSRTLTAFSEEFGIACSSDVISSNNGTQARSSSLVELCVKDFTGRVQEIRDIIVKLAEDAKAESAKQKDKSFGASGSGSVVIIKGMGGVGKTQLAYAVAQQLAQQYPDGLVEVNLRGADKKALAPESVLLTVLQKLLKLPSISSSITPSRSDSLKDDYRTLLEGKSVLIVADNAQDYEQVKPLASVPLGCDLIVTTRLSINHPGGIPIQIGPLPHSVAEAMLCKICKRIGKDAAELARLCGYLPLALRISANRLEADPSFPVGEYLSNLANDPLVQLSDPIDKDLIVEASLRLSWDPLTPTARNVLAQLSIFRISFDFAAAQGILHLPKGAPKLRQVISELFSYSLLTWEDSTKYYTIHDLVGAFARTQLKAIANSTYLRYAQYYVELAEKAEALYRKTGDTAAIVADEGLQPEELLHLNVVWAWLLSARRSPTTNKLLLRFAECSIYTEGLFNGSRQQRIQQWNIILGIAQRQNDLSSQITAWGGLASSYTNLDKPDNQDRLRQAIDCFRQQITIAQEIKAYSREAAATWNLSLALEALDPISVADLERAVRLAQDYIDYNKEQIKDADRERLAKLRTRIAELGAGSKPAYVPEPTRQESFDRDELDK